MATSIQQRHWPDSERRQPRMQAGSRMVSTLGQPFCSLVTVRILSVAVLLFLFLNIFIDSRERDEGRERERNIIWLPLAHAPTRDWTPNLGMCLEWESNLWPFGNTLTSWPFVWSFPPRSRISSSKLYSEMKLRSLVPHQISCLPWLPSNFMGLLRACYPLSKSLRPG